MYQISCNNKMKIAASKGDESIDVKVSRVTFSASFYVMFEYTLLVFHLEEKKNERYLTSAIFHFDKVITTGYNAVNLINSTH